uniref:Uncharacterized protein n=1 Tax=Stomoxys calcitrans TaxID=35570 RepID=A0A1I8P0Z2_STOCA
MYRHIKFLWNLDELAAMNFIESKESLDFNPSSDELMLKELERRDGIYSFIFHELEATTEKKNERRFNEKRPESGCNGVNSNSNVTIESKAKLEHIQVNGSHHKQIISYESTRSQEQTKLTLGNIKLEGIPTSNPSTIPKSLDSSNTMSSWNPLYTSNCYENGMITQSSEFWRAWHSSNLNSSSCRFPEQLNLLNVCPKQTFGIRNATPGFSHIAVKLERHRKHPLKETPEYKKWFDSPTNGKIPDLRSLFPYDPDVHAPFKPLLDDGIVAQSTRDAGGQ